jgi:hypothetical protein
MLRDVGVPPVAASAGSVTRGADLTAPELAAGRAATMELLEPGAFGVAMSDAAARHRPELEADEAIGAVSNLPELDPADAPPPGLPSETTGADSMWLELVA